MMFLYSIYNSSFGLSTNEILEISEAINRKFTPSASTTSPLTANLTPQEMLAISDEISREFSPSHLFDFPQLVLLPVDPEHLYAYWNVLEKNEPDPPDKPHEPLTLRIYAESGKQNSGITAHLCFDTPVKNLSMQQSIKLPVQDTQTTYSAEIGRYESDAGFVPVMHSNSIRLPRANWAPGLNPEISEALQALSGNSSAKCEKIADPGKYISSSGIH